MTVHRWVDKTGGSLVPLPAGAALPVRGEDVGGAAVLVLDLDPSVSEDLRLRSGSRPHTVGSPYQSMGLAPMRRGKPFSRSRVRL
jgi:hypothetical protein